MASRTVQTNSLLNSAIAFVLNEKFESAAGCFEALLILIDANPDKFNYSSERLLSLKFALCCCYFYAEIDHERNLQLLKDIQNLDNRLPAVDYMTAATLYKLNVPLLALKSVESGLQKILNCTLIKFYFWPETDVVINLSEEGYVKRKLEELKEQMQSSGQFISFTSENSNPINDKISGLVSCSKLNATATEFHPTNSQPKLEARLEPEAVNSSVLKDELQKQYQLLQKIHFKIESQPAVYENKINELERKLEEKDKLITILSNKDKISCETSEKILSSIKSIIVGQNIAEIEKLKLENSKLKSIITQLIEKYFSVQFIISKNNEGHCLSILEKLDVLLKNQNSCYYLNSVEIEEEIDVWKTKLNNVQKHRAATENTLMLLKSNISESHLKLLNELLQGCSCIIDKPDLLQKICLKNVLKDVENSTSGSSINYDYESDYYLENGTTKDWKFHLRQRRIASFGLCSTNDPNTEFSNTDINESGQHSAAAIKQTSFTVESNSNDQQTWVDQEIAKLSERVKLIGGPNYWRLIVFMKDKLPMESEDTIVDAVEMVRASQGKLNGLSRDQIFNKALSIIKASKVKKKNFIINLEGKPDSTTCSVCLEPYNLNSSAILTCGHQFHKSCIQTWLRKESLCPICRAFIVPQEYNTLKGVR